MRRGIGGSRADRGFTVLVYAVLVFSLVVVLVPLLFIVSSSFSSPEAILRGSVFLVPVEPTLAGYAAVFKDQQVYLGFAYSLLYTAAGALLSAALTMLTAYPLSRKELRSRGAFMVFFVVTMLFSGGLIPYYMVVKNMRLINTVWAMFVPNALSAYNVIIARTYIKSAIPEELYESASLEGCSHARYLVKMIIPLSAPILAVVILWVAIGQWNSYFNALLFLNDSGKYPLQMVLRQLLIVQNASTDLTRNPKQYLELIRMRNLMQYSLIVVSSIPLMLLYPVAQRYFTQGIMLGSLKG
jgi:putative aldouronate transport system permease protein